MTNKEIAEKIALADRHLNSIPVSGENVFNLSICRSTLIELYRALNAEEKEKSDEEQEG